MSSNISNPYITKSMAETGPRTTKTCTYGGIMSKTMLFLLTILIGAFAFRAIPVPIQYLNGVLIGASIATLIIPFLIYFVPKGRAFFGILFCLVEGYLIGYTCTVYALLYDGIIPVAVVLTLCILTTLVILYGTGIIKVHQKFKAVIITLLIASAIFGVVVFISSFFTDTLVRLYVGNGPVAIGFSIIMLLIAASAFVMDLDNIALAVNRGLDKENEWLLAYGIILSIILVFLRVLRLLAQLASRRNR